MAVWMEVSKPSTTDRMNRLPGIRDKEPSTRPAKIMMTAAGRDRLETDNCPAARRPALERQGIQVEKMDG